MPPEVFLETQADLLADLVRRLAELALKVARAGRIEAELLEAEIGATEMDQLAAIAGGRFDRDSEALPPEGVIKKPETKPIPTPTIYMRDRYTFGR